MGVFFLQYVRPFQASGDFETVLFKVSAYNEGYSAHLFLTGAAFAEIGDFHKNGNWFYHTHIQVITGKSLELGYVSKGYCTEKDLVEINDLCPSPIPMFIVGFRSDS